MHAVNHNTCHSSFIVVERFLKAINANALFSYLYKFTIAIWYSYATAVFLTNAVDICGNMTVIIIIKIEFYIHSPIMVGGLL